MASWPNTPAIVLARHLDVLATNALTSALSPVFTPGVKVVRAVFLDPELRNFVRDCEEVARSAVATTRWSPTASRRLPMFCSVEAAARWAESGITANAVHPGAVIDTNLARELDPDALAIAIETAGYEYKTREQGAATSVLVAASPMLEGVTGRYFADCNEAPVVDSTFTGPPRGFGVAPYALDREDASRLWNLSPDLVDGGTE